MFKCYRCIHCCFFAGPPDYPILTIDEKRRLEKIAKLRNIELSFREVGEGLYEWVINGFCPFYDIESRGCVIYDERPIPCRMYPLLLNPQSGEVSMSLLCDWVADNFNEIVKIGDPLKVFPNEVREAIVLFSSLRRS